MSAMGCVHRQADASKEPRHRVRRPPQRISSRIIANAMSIPARIAGPERLLSRRLPAFGGRRALAASLEMPDGISIGMRHRKTRSPVVHFQTYQSGLAAQYCEHLGTWDMRGVISSAAMLILPRMRELISCLVFEVRDCKGMVKSFTRGTRNFSSRMPSE